jgi:hypothetical protein
MNWLNLLGLVLHLAAYLARRADRLDIEKKVLNDLENLHEKRVDDAVRARGDVLAGRVQLDPDDPNRRD